MNINFRHNINGENVITAIVQDYKTLEVLMVAYMNSEALDKTLTTGNAHFWSTSRNRLWMKGEESGNTQEVKEVLVDCDEDAVILKVKQNIGACHTGHYSCFYRTLSVDGSDLKENQKKVFNPDEVY